MADTLQLSRWAALRDAPKMLKNPLPVIRGHLEESGGIYKSYLGPKPVCITDLPAAAIHVLQTNQRNYIKPRHTYGILADYIGNGLLTIDGDDWRTRRKMIQPGFHPKRIQALADTMLRETETTLERLAASSAALDWEAETTDLTSRIIGRALFGAGLSIEEVRELRDIIAAAEGQILKRIRFPFVSILSAITGAERNVQARLSNARGEWLSLLKRRRESSEEHDDLAQMLMDARFEDTNEGLSDEQLMDEALTFYVAGHETTAHALAWFVFEVGQRPDLQTQLRAEVLNAVGDRDVDLDDLPSLQLLTSAIKETLRLHPPAWMLDREPIETDVIEGVEVPPGWMVGVCIYSMHRNSNIWPDAESFVADRFIEHHRSHDAWMPFGAGPRKCIGVHFAMMEMQLVLAQLVKRFSFQVSDPAAIAEKAAVTLGMNGALMTKFTAAS